MRSLLLASVLLALSACQPANDKSDTGEAIARDAGVGDAPTGRSGRPIARSAENVSIPANIDEGVEPASDTNLSNDVQEEEADETIEGNLVLDPPPDGA